MAGFALSLRVSGRARRASTTYFKEFSLFIMVATTRVKSLHIKNLVWVAKAGGGVLPCVEILREVSQPL